MIPATDIVRDAVRETDLVITCEEHSVVSGIGGGVAEIMAEEIAAATRQAMAASA